MELTQLRTFYLVANYKSFSRAAAELHLTQPAVTLQIKNLETEVGELLFERLNRTLNLTPAGEIFLNYVQQILNLTEEASETIQQYAKLRGRITIAAGTTNTIYRLPLILRDYHQAYPQVEIRIRNGDSQLSNQLVHNNAVDLALVTTINPVTNLHVIPLFKDPILLIAPKGFPTQISIIELENELLILFRTGSGFQRFLEEQFKINNFITKTTMEMESIEAIIRLVQSGLGISFLPEIAVKEELERGTLQKVNIPGWNYMVRQTYLVYRQDKYLTWPVKAFLDQILGK